MRLYVNIDHVATLREARQTVEPDPVAAAAAAERGGADGITVHLREDRRHIQDADVVALARSVRTVVNLELGAHPEIVRLACRVRPFQATLVPERRREITTEGGLALRRGDRRLAAAIGRLQDAGIRVSLFIDPVRKTIDQARALGVPAIEIHTGKYAHSWRRGQTALKQLRQAAAYAKGVGLAVHAGHGLTYQNVQPVAAIHEIEELNIGHSIVSNAVFWGLEEAVRRMKQLVQDPGDAYLGVEMTTPTPGQPLGMSDFFALEAGEYLDRLDAILQGDAAPAADEFVRLSRALRGSALMASQQAIARAATGIEALARAVREGRRAWDPATKQVAIRAVDDLKIFVRKAATWSEADTAKAEALAAQLEQLAGRPSAQVRAAEAMGLDAGARAFVAREGAAIASALDRAGQTLRANPLAHDPLQNILKALQPLRGLAALNDLPPLPDLLEGIERAIGELGRSTAAPATLIGELFQAAATAIAHAAREVAERGRPDPEGAEFRRFAGLLMRFMESEPDVVPIDTLFHGDAGPHIVQRGTPPARPATLGRLELVSHGEHLRQAADSLERAPSPTQRELRAHTLAGTFRALGGAGGGAVAERVAEFAQVAREAVSKGIAVKQAAVFAVELRRAGEILSRSGSGDEATLATELAAVTAAVRALSDVSAPPPAAVVPIESLAPAPAPRVSAPRVSAPVAEPEESVPESADLVGTWATYQRLAAPGFGASSLDELLKGPGAATEGPEDPRKSFRAPRGGSEPAVVDIAKLLYRGARARQRAQELRETAKRVSGDDLRAIIDEVCDLVVLAIEPE